MSRVRVKICGITNEQDALGAIAAGADALGFNTWPGSSRYLDLAAAAEWIARLPGPAKRVAVLVNVSPEEALRVARLPFIDLVQFHGDETPEYCAEFARSGRPFIKALRLQPGKNPVEGGGYATSAVLLDANVPGQFGGTGAVADWSLAARFVRENRDLRVFLAGGLTPENVGEAIRAVSPHAVDVAGGVELSPGRKDPERMQNFIARARAVG
jgi:phosphoribosylanthranilate isomerase